MQITVSVQIWEAPPCTLSYTSTSYSHFLSTTSCCKFYLLPLLGVVFIGAQYNFCQDEKDRSLRVGWDGMGWSPHVGQEGTGSTRKTGSTDRLGQAMGIGRERMNEEERIGKALQVRQDRTGVEGRIGRSGTERSGKCYNFCVIPICLFTSQKNTGTLI